MSDITYQQLIDSPGEEFTAQIRDPKKVEFHKTDGSIDDCVAEDVTAIFKEPDEIYIEVGSSISSSRPFEYYGKRAIWAMVTGNIQGVSFVSDSAKFLFPGDEHVPCAHIKADENAFNQIYGAIKTYFATIDSEEFKEALRIMQELCGQEVAERFGHLVH